MATRRAFVRSTVVIRSTGVRLLWKGQGKKPSKIRPFAELGVLAILRSTGQCKVVVSLPISKYFRLH